MVNEGTVLLKDGEKIELGDAKGAYYQGTEPQTPVEKLAISTLRGPLKPINTFLNNVEHEVVNFYNERSVCVKITAAVILVSLYLVYFIVACYKDFERAKHLVYITAFALFCFLYWLIKKFAGRTIWKTVLKPIHNAILGRWVVIKWISIIAFFIFVICWIVIDTYKEPSRLVSLAGLFIYMFIGFLFSKARDQIKWRPIIWGFVLQFVFGLLILRSNPGYQFFKWLGDVVANFLSYSTAGSEFLFRSLPQFAFTILPIIVYFSAVTYLVYYLGILQIVIIKIAWLLQVTLGTSPAESVNAAGNIFIGQTEAPLLIRPFLEGMTDSELHAVMTGGFATIAGSVLGAYISFGVSSSHLLSASVMSAPAALAMAKLMYPETEEPEVKNVDDINIDRGNEKNLFEAIAVGASMSIGLVANIAVMLIAFLSILALVNAILHWFGAMIDVPQLSFEYICSYVFMPFAFIMGVDWKDSFLVAELLGTKTFLNEFVAYKGLAKLIKNRVNKWDGPSMSIRSEVIATYALCGFANFGSMGVQLGGISSLAPSRLPSLSKVVLRALVAGTLACFMTACIAGLLYDEAKYDTTITPAPTNSTINSTVATTLSVVTKILNTTISR